MTAMRFLVWVCFVGVCACGGDDSSSNTSTPDAAVPNDSSVAAVAPLTINGCTAYVDRTADDADREIEWKVITPKPAEWCMKIKAGQSVVWRATDAGGFNTHPLDPHNGDTGNPINAAGTGDVTSHTFPEGNKTFGFWCTIHTTLMQGAIYVVP